MWCFLAFVVGAVTTFCVLATAEADMHRSFGRNGFIIYSQQRQDKELCEQDIKRSEHCMPIMMWLPEAAQ